MSVLVIAEHNNTVLKDSTLSTITAARQLSAEIDILIIGYECEDAVESASLINGINKVLHADAIHYANFLAEEITPLILSIADAYSHLLVPATTFGKNLIKGALPTYSQR